jgi:UDP-GlcNAc:undecaprenyl-phosphate/decaprenyl-phosphate GlcNAc-1-phosphate transferase
MNQILNDSNILSVMLISCLVSAVMAVMLLRIVIMVSEKYGLFDKPNERKVHKTPIPSMGGVSLMGGVFISLMFSLLRGIDTQLLSIYGCLFIISVVGLIDDLKDISARARFVIEFAIAAFLIYNGIEIKNWHHLFGTDELPLYLTHALNMFLIVGMINAYNLIDGIDGLAGGLSFISITFVGTLFYRVGLYDYSILAFTLAAALATFMTFNANPAKIFLGDTGSLTLGMLIAVFVIKLWGIGKGYQTSVTQIDYWKIVLTLPAIPVLDALRVAVGRVAKGRSPFSADKTHIHHLLLKLGYKPFQASIVLWILQCTFVTVLLLIKPEGIWTEILMVICLYVAFYFAIIKMTQKLEIERRKILSKFDTI